MKIKGIFVYIWLWIERNWFGALHTDMFGHFLRWNSNFELDCWFRIQMCCFEITFKFVYFWPKISLKFVYFCLSIRILCIYSHFEIFFAVFFDEIQFSGQVFSQITMIQNFWFSKSFWPKTQYSNLYFNLFLKIQRFKVQITKNSRGFG